MDYKMPHNLPRSSSIQPRIIIHGGAGNINPVNLTPEQWAAYRTSLLSILRSTSSLLAQPDTDALTAAVHAVRLFEEDPLFNCGHGAVFTRDGHVELEASVMVTRGYRKRGTAVSLLRHVKSPITLAAEMLRRSNMHGVGPEEDAQGHVHLSGDYLEGLARNWGCEMVDEEYFWTRKRWDEHIRGLEREKSARTKGQVSQPTPHPQAQQVDNLHPTADTRPDGRPWPDNDPTWDGISYLPQGTVGCVVLDRFGALCAATSTGGLTNKLPGRIGDTPTMGAGFWAEEWTETYAAPMTAMASGITALLPADAYASRLVRELGGTLADALGRERLPGFLSACLPASPSSRTSTTPSLRAVAVSGTGNGDSFLQLSAARTCASVPRLQPSVSLAKAVSWMTGPGGELQRSAGDRWGRTGEGLGGIIGIELKEGRGEVVADFNVGMFRAWVDDEGVFRVAALRDGEGGGEYV